MLTPIDIQNKNFRLELRGYNKQEVDEFLNLIMESYEKLFKENIEARDKIKLQSDALEQYKTTGEALQSALMVAQTVAGDIKKNAMQDSEDIIDGAKAEAARIISEAHASRDSMLAEYKSVKENTESFKSKLRNVGESQNAILNKTKQTTAALEDLIDLLETINKDSNVLLENSIKKNVGISSVNKIDAADKKDKKNDKKNDKIEKLDEDFAIQSELFPSEESFAAITTQDAPRRAVDELRQIDILNQEPNDEKIEIKVTRDDHAAKDGMDLSKIRITHTGTSQVYELDTLINNIKNKRNGIEATET